MLTQTLLDAVQAFERAARAAHDAGTPPSAARAAFEDVLVSFHLFEQALGE